MTRLAVLTLGALTLTACAGRHSTGVGGGLVGIPGVGGERAQPGVTPSLVLDRRSVPAPGKVVGFVHRNSITLHDWKAAGDVAAFYARGWPDHSVHEPALDAAWYIGGFPILVMAPLAGSDIAMQPGLTIRPGEGMDRLLPYLEVGPSLSLWLRPSYPALLVDLNVGGWAGVGMPITPTVDLGIRTSVEVPLFHTWLGDVSGPVVTTAAMVSFRRLTKEERKARDAPPGLPAPEPSPPAEAPVPNDDPV